MYRICAVSYTHLDVYKRQILFCVFLVEPIQTVQNKVLTIIDLMEAMRQDYGSKLSAEMCIRDSSHTG